MSDVTAVLYNIYHTVKVGHRPLVDSAIAQRRFGKIHKLSFEVASIFKRRYRSNSPCYIELEDMSSQLFLPVAAHEDPDLVEIAPGVFAHRDSSIYRDLNRSPILLSSAASSGSPITGSFSPVVVDEEVA